MQNASAFTAATPKAFLTTLKALTKTTDKAPGMKQALSAGFRAQHNGCPIHEPRSLDALPD
jgi:hypothetical protein